MQRESRRKKYDAQLFKYAKISITAKRLAFFWPFDKLRTG
jgi:hypothetical protein